MSFTIRDERGVACCVVVIGRDAGYHIAKETDICCIGDDAQSPEGVSGWVHIKGVYNGPMSEGKIARWREICGSLIGALPSEMAVNIAQVEEVIPPVSIDRDKLRLYVLSVIADDLYRHIRVSAKW